MNRRIYYVLADKYIITQYEVEKAFYVTHGYCCYRDEREFLKWLYSLLGKTIIQVIPEQEMEVEKLAECRAILAMKLYRDRYGCTLTEAKKYVENYLNKT